MEYIRGQSLRRLVADQGPLSAARAAHLFAEVADGLAHAHATGLVHRDLKPANIMVTPNGHAKILDLGLALAVDEELPADKKIVGGQGYVVGTMDYIAPEQVDDPTGVDARADLYAMGCSLYFALTGQPPFPGGTSQEKMKRHRTEHPDPLTDFNPTVPVEFARVVQKLMEKVPGRRYPTAKVARDALLPWAAADPETPYDVDPDQTAAEVVLELERTVKDPGEFFESVPVVVFADKGRRSGRLPDSCRARGRTRQRPQETETERPALDGPGADRAGRHVPGGRAHGAGAVPVEGLAGPERRIAEKWRLSRGRAASIFFLTTVDSVVPTI